MGTGEDEEISPSRLFILSIPLILSARLRLIAAIRIASAGLS